MIIRYEFFRKINHSFKTTMGEEYAKILNTLGKKEMGVLESYIKSGGTDTLSEKEYWKVSWKKPARPLLSLRQKRWIQIRARSSYHHNEKITGLSQATKKILLLRISTNIQLQKQWRMEPIYLQRISPSISQIPQKSIVSPFFPHNPLISAPKTPHSSPQHRKKHKRAYNDISATKK